jgi:hypothetical protein
MILIKWQSAFAKEKSEMFLPDKPFPCLTFSDETRYYSVVLFIMPVISLKNGEAQEY